MHPLPAPDGELRLRKLRWLCRRGMRELDVLLEHFVACNTAALQAGQWPELESLLALEDDRLWDILVTPAKCTADEPLSLVLLISNSNRHGFSATH